MDEWIFPIFFFSFSQWRIELISVKRTLADCFHGSHIDQKLPEDTCTIDKTDKGGLKLHLAWRSISSEPSGTGAASRLFSDLNGVETSLVPLR